MIGREDSIGHAVYGIYASGIDGDGFRWITRFLHPELTSLTLPYPVALHLLDPLWPVECIDI